MLLPDLLMEFKLHGLHEITALYCQHCLLLWSDAESPPKAIPQRSAGWCYWRHCGPSGGEALWEVLRWLGIWSQRGLWDPSLSSWPWNEQIALPYSPRHGFGTSTRGLKAIMNWSLKTMSQKNLFSFKLFFSAILSLWQKKKVTRVCKEFNNFTSRHWRHLGN